MKGITHLNSDQVKNMAKDQEMTDTAERTEPNSATTPLFYRLFILFLLYSVQGVPYGFFTSALPLFLREAGWSRTALGFLNGLSIPWFFKFSWAPLVDRFYFTSFGKRKSWIIPCTAVFIILLFLLSLNNPASETTVFWLLFIVLTVNATAATQDIAVDGLAVDILTARDRGPGNAVQVVGFKAGMLFSGGILLGLNAYLGWNGICMVMSLIAAVVFIFAIRFPESQSSDTLKIEKVNIPEILRSMLKLITGKGMIMAILLIATYKMGEQLVDSMYKIFLKDGGLSIAAIGIMSGTWGLLFSIAGSTIGGFLARDANRLDVLLGVGAVRFLPLAAIAVLPFLPNLPSLWVLYPISLAENFAGGMLTTVTFAFMMDLCDRRVGATHFTTLAAIEVAGKFGISLFAGLLVDYVGYGLIFSIGAGISAAWVLLVQAARHSALNPAKTAT